LSLHQAIELSLKGRLAREDPLLIQREVDGNDVLESIYRKGAGLPVPPPRLTIDFMTAVERAAALSNSRHLYASLGTFNELRNELVHLGASRIPARIQELAIHRALTFAVRHLSSELGVRASLVERDSLAHADLRLTQSETQADKDFDAKLQKHWNAHRRLSERERERRKSDAIPPEEPYMTAICPGCGETAFVSLVDWPAPDFPGDPPDRARVVGFACPVCNLHLADGELDQYEYLAMEYVEGQDLRDAWNRWKHY
jgi:hypothetical protein